jgi:YidC/Oxa1 family membrane protein insertase
MNDIRRTILWVIFGFSMVLLWDQWQIHNGHKATFFPAPAKTTSTSQEASGAAQSAPSQATSMPAPSSSANLPAPSGAQAVLPGSDVGATGAGEKLTVASDVLRLTFDTEGGTLLKSEFLKHQEIDEKDKNVVLLDQTKDRLYVAQTGLIGAAAGSALPTHKTPMTLKAGPTEFKDGSNEINLVFESQEVGGVKLVKTYTISRDTYSMGVKHEVINNAATAIAPQLYLQLVRDGNKPLGESAFYSTFTGPAVYTDAKKYQKVEFSDIEKNKFDIEKQADNGYVAMVQHYFASAWLLPAGVDRDLFMRKVNTNLYAAGMITQFGEMAPGSSKAVQATLFVGPQLEKDLEKLAPGLELVKDYGWLTILAKPLYWLLDQLHTYLQNWGWAIVALVVLLKIAFYWLNAKAYASMAKMKAINPKVMEMRERLKDKPQQMQQEMMRMYREEKVNPMGGCLPIMIQIPVFIALYWVLLSSVEIRNAPWIFWIKDLSAADPFFLLPLLMTLSTLLQTALNPTPPDPLQAKMMWILPLAFSVMFFFFPAGLVLYWLTNNILSIAQQWLINKRMGVPPEFNLPKFR